MITQWLLRVVCGVLGDFFLAFVRALRTARADDESLLLVVYEIVVDLDRAHPDWSNQRKLAWAQQRIKTYAASLGTDLQDSLINALIELSVLRLKAERGQ